MRFRRRREPCHGVPDLHRQRGTTAEHDRLRPGGQKSDDPCNHYTVRGDGSIVPGAVARRIKPPPGGTQSGNGPWNGVSGGLHTPACLGRRRLWCDQRGTGRRRGSQQGGHHHGCSQREPSTPGFMAVTHVPLHGTDAAPRLGRLATGVCPAIGSATSPVPEP